MKRHPNPWRRAALLSFLALLCAAWLTFAALFSPAKENTVTLEIPDLCDKPLASATLDGRFEVEIEYRYDTKAPAGTVLSQSPAAGSRRKLTRENPQCTLSLTVSLGKEAVTLPNLVGKDARDAAAELRKLGLAVETVTVNSAYRAGTVLSSLPKAGTRLPKGETVVLNVSGGIPTGTVTVPDLAGLSRSDALIALWTAQLAVREVVEVDSDAPAGSVIRQSHRPGTVVAAGTGMTLYVSRERGEE
ncbi:MAG: PASTA domain-containing protein [Clostridia bacterium]|nr:PASTA domain-containing protein [Clostridia bacterium]